ncbi:MAG: hypothetical protein Q9160_005513 [Pyrenula sp. 1 TL-2023]
MDSGLLELTEPVGDHYDVLKELIPAEVLGVMDQMLSHEEEDFSSQLYNRQLLHHVDVDEIQLLLDDAQGWLEDTDISTDIVQALEQRLVFRQELLSAFQRDAAMLVQGDSSAHATCLVLISSIRNNHSSAISVEEAFSLKLQTTLASSVPPRPMVNIAFAETLNFLSTLLQDTIDLAFLEPVRGNENIFHAICLFMARDPQPAVYVRSLLQSCLYQNSLILGRNCPSDFVLSDLQSLVLPGNTWFNRRGAKGDDNAENRLQISLSMNEFCERVSQQYLNSFRSACLNRARLRRTLRHFAAEWDDLQVDGEQIDTRLQALTNEEAMDYPSSVEKAFSYPLSSWMYHYKLIQLRYIIQLGFEQCIYATEEIPGMLWYLSHVCTTHLAHLNRMSFFVEAGGRRDIDETGSEQPNNESASDPLAHLDAALWKIDRTFQEVRAHDNLAEALHALYILLQRHSLVANPSRPYSSNELRYELRMKPFLPLAIPSVVPYNDFSRENALSDETDLAVAERAQRASGEARKSWENVLKDGWMETTQSGTNGANAREFDLQSAWNLEVKNNIRASIATSIAVALIKNRLSNTWASNNAKDGQDGSKVPASPMSGLQVSIPSPGEKGSYSSYWPVPAIQA